MRARWEQVDTVSSQAGQASFPPHCNISHLYKHTIKLNWETWDKQVFPIIFCLQSTCRLVQDLVGRLSFSKAAQLSLIDRLYLSGSTYPLGTTRIRWQLSNNTLNSLTSVIWPRGHLAKRVCTLSHPGKVHRPRKGHFIWFKGSEASDSCVILVMLVMLALTMVITM